MRTGVKQPVGCEEECRLLKKHFLPLALSATRGATLSEQLAMYRWSVELCEALYPGIHFLRWR